MAWTKERLRDLVKDRLGDGLFIVVSNREPYIHRYDGEEIVCQVPASGMTIALDPVMKACGGLWIAHGSGEADKEVVDANDHVKVPPDNPSYNLRRIWLTKQEEDEYYYGFSNEALWPLCHIAYTRPIFDEQHWKSYKAVNRKFADAILAEVGDRNAFVFIQDYHFALVSRMIKRPNIRTAQFWHIPWSNPEAFRVCPWAEELLDGLLGNDLLGFHIRYHCQNYLDTVDRLIEARVDYEKFEVTRRGNTTMVQPFPISVDFEAISEQAGSVEIEAEVKRLKRKHGLRDEVIALGIDRIDYTKGIAERLRAIDRLLEKHPELHKRFIFVSIGVPSRVHIPAYKQLNDEIDQLVESINWKYRVDHWKPIIYLRRHFPPVTLYAWHQIAKICMVSSLHDGMNMVAKEFVASRIHEDGVLILSHFTGAARELTQAELINPFAVDEVADVLYRSINMSTKEQKRRMRRMRQQVKEQNIYKWAGRVLSSLFSMEFEDN